jgi:hypothetical protein
LFQFLNSSAISGHLPLAGTPAGALQRHGDLAFLRIAAMVLGPAMKTVAQRQLQSFNTPGTGHIELGNSSECGKFAGRR